MQADPIFAVNPYNDPIVVRIQGKATFLNCGPLKEFLDGMIQRGKRQFIVDFQQCRGMDSTFLGILAGVGIRLMRADPPGKVVLARLGTRNLELVRNLGLHRVMLVDEQGLDVADESLVALAGESAQQHEEITNARMVLAAHENLVAVDAANEAKFQDVIAFLKNQVDMTS
jgi:anti-sigma B factor antagonist